MRTDMWAQALLAVPCGLLLSCALYKANCVEGLERFHPADGVFGHCKQSEQLVLKCCMAFVAHVLLHLFLLYAVVPLFGHGSKERITTTYEECARRLPHSYFSTNPVHCLRSEHIYDHDPPFVFSRAGKEHLMPRNAEIGAFFRDASASCEDYSASIEALQGLSHLARRASQAPDKDFLAALTAMPRRSLSGSFSGSFSGGARPTSPQAARASEASEASETSSASSDSE